MKTLLAFAMAIALLTSFMPVASQAQESPPMVAEPTPGAPPQGGPGPGGPHHGGRFEHHPVLHKAIHKLEKAKEDLEHAAHDYDGHRAKAIELINGALGELQQALQSDRH